MSSHSKSDESPTAFGDYAGGIDLAEPNPAAAAEPGFSAESELEKDGPSPVLGVLEHDGEQSALQPPGDPVRPVAALASHGPELLGPDTRGSYPTGAAALPWGTLVLLVVLALLGYGGYYGYCSYQAKSKRYEFTRSLGDLRQSLLKLDRRIGAEEVRGVVLGLAAKADVLVDPADIRPFLEPLSPLTAAKLPSVARMALGIAAKLKDHRTPQLVVGFKVSFVARHGIASGRFEAERYTWFDQ